MRPSGVITLLTDFGTRDAYAGIMKGVALSVNPRARLVDLTHEIPPQAVVLGALVLRSAVEFFPAGTVHLAVVDPGVGSQRQPVAVVTDRGYLVGPDNGLLAPAAAAMGLRGTRRLEREAFFRRPVSHTFHGRDVFAPVAAHLAAGLSPEALGPMVPALRPLALPEPREENGRLHGEVIYVDHFGNLVTNVPAAALGAFPAQTLSVRIGRVTISTLSAAYAAVPPRAPVALIGSWGLLEIAVREGSAAAQFGAGLGTPVEVAGG